jgi:2,3-dihydroxybenzoate-AMP ligase
MTANHIAFHAADRPDAVALINNGREITYGEFSRDIRKFTRALRAFGLPPGGSVAVGCEDIYIHWLLLLAFERLGVVTASFNNGDGWGLAQLSARLNLVLSEPHFPAEGAIPHHRITPQWLQSVLAQRDGDDERPAFGLPDDAVRITRTSGTTGAFKMLLYSRRLLTAWGDKWMWLWGLTRWSRFLLTMPFTVSGVYACAAAFLRSGATVVVENRMTVGQALSHYGITHALFLPIQLRHTLDELPQDYEKPPGLTITTFGAALSRPLWERAITQLASDVWDMYGCNEVDFICATRIPREDDAKFLLPGVQVEVIDDRDQPLPLGSMGRIRVKTERMVAGYLDDPEATRYMFRDGWFYPGDMGILRSPGQLQVAGRGDEIMNIGGVKYPPSLFEDLVLRHAKVGDVGVCSIRNSEGIEEVCVAVSHADGEDTELLERIAGAFSHIQLGKFHVVRLDRIPRNEAGKIQRDRLKSAIAVSMGRSARSTPKNPN